MQPYVSYVKLSLLKKIGNSFLRFVEKKLFIVFEHANNVNTVDPLNRVTSVQDILTRLSGI